MTTSTPAGPLGRAGHRALERFVRRVIGVPGAVFRRVVFDTAFGLCVSDDALGRAGLSRTSTGPAASARNGRVRQGRRRPREDVARA